VWYFFESRSIISQTGKISLLRSLGKGSGFFSAVDEEFSGLIQTLRAKNWVVFSKKPFAGPQEVLDYIGRYTHRVAISNNRIVNVDDGKVTFTYRDRKNDNTLRIKTLVAEEFIRRFLLHVLPEGFMKIRHFGFLSNRRKKDNIQRCGALPLLFFCSGRSFIFSPDIRFDRCLKP